MEPRARRSADRGGGPGAPEEPDEIVFGFTHPNGFGSPDTSAFPPTLELTFVPEPATAMLLVVVATALGGRPRRKH